MTDFAFDYVVARADRREQRPVADDLAARVIPPSPEQAELIRSCFAEMLDIPSNTD